MAEQESRRGKSRRERVEFARSRNILDVANELQMELVRSGRDYRWKEHDSLVISPDKNLWKWFSRNTGGDSISLVETIKEVDFNQSVDFLNDGNFKEFQMVERPQEDFKYYLEKYEQPFSDGRNYLRNQRGLSDETIDYFLEQGVLAQANAKLDYFAEGSSGSSTNAIEPVIVFKSLSSSGEVVGASLQGIQENWEKWPKHGYAKVIMKNSDPMTGIHVNIGSPKRLIFTESPIDLMSYYELHKDSLQDVRLVSMDGLKESTIGRHLSQIQAEMSGKALIWTPEQLADGLQVAIDRHFFENKENADLITLALDNDNAGRTFIQELEAKGAVINSDLPELRPGQDKTDWNDALRTQNQQSLVDLSAVSAENEKSFNNPLDLVRELHRKWEDELAEKIREDLGINHELQAWQFEKEMSRFITTDLDKLFAKRTRLERDAYFADSATSIRKEIDRLDAQILEYIEKNPEQSQEKTDWNDTLRTQNQQSLVDLSAVSAENEKSFNNPLDLVRELHRKWEDELAEKIREDLGINHELQAWQFEKEMSRFITTDLDKLFAKRTRLERDAYFADSATSIRKEIDRLDAQILEYIEKAPEQSQEKTDWNDILKNQQEEKSDNSRLAQARRKVALELTEEGEFQLSSQTKYHPKTDEERLKVDELLAKQRQENVGLTPSNQEKSISPQPEPIEKNQGEADLMSRLDTQPIKIIEASEEKEKSLDNYQETNTGGELLNRNSSSLGVETPGTAPQPVEKNSQPDFPANVRLHFTIDEDRMSNKKFRKNMRTLNLYANAMRDSAQWYLKEMSGTSIHYVYRNPEEKQFQILNVKFDKKNWMHLTGVTPVYNEWVEHLSESFVEDVAAGKGHFKDLKFANGMSDKLKVLNLLPEVIESDSFVFNDLSSVKKFNNLDLSKAIRPEDTDLLLLFKEKEFTHVPASLMRVKGDLNKQLEDIDTGTILGVYRERDGQIEQLSINDEYVKDGGEEMLSVLRNKQYEEIPKESEQTTSVNTIDKTSLDSVTFTQVLDTVYNLGVPNDISKTPEEFHKAWDQYLDYAKKYNDKFDQIVAAAGEDHLLDINTDFYKEWTQDHIYKENYHVRLQWSEERPDGPRLPFKETELISYQDFARELYKANQDFYPIHQEGMRQVTAGTPEAYIPPTKIKFDVYAPGGEMIKEGIRYDVGDETKPISQMLGLGYRRLNGQSELALMDEEILSQLENREVNKGISLEANESARLIGEGEGQTLDTRETVAFQSSKQETKNNFLQRVEEILKEEPISELETPEVNPNSIDYATLTPHELSEVAFQKVREYTETPERLEEYLNFMSKFPELSPRNVALIQEQWPGANAVATYNQWQSMGEVLGITSDQVFETRNTYTNKKTGRTREVVHNNLSVKTGEKSHITLFRPMMVEMIPVLDENGNQVKNGKGNPKYKRLSEATPEEKALKKEGKLKSRFFQERDSNTGLAKFATYKVFELSQTTLKPEFYPKAMPNRHYDFNMDHIRTKEVLEGLSDYAKDIGVTIYQDDARELRSAKGAFYSDEQKILLNPDNTPGEVIATTIHELAHASLHNPKFANSYKEDVSKDRRELEAEMTSYLVSKHFGLDTSEKAIRYMALWTDNLTSLDDQQLAQSMKRIHGTVSKIVKSVEQHTKPYQLNRQVVQNQNFIQSPKKGLKV